MAEGGVMDYLNAFNAGFKSSVDIFNYPQQQQLATEQARANVALTKQNIKANDLTFQEKMLALQATKRKEEQDTIINQKLATEQVGADTSVAEAGTKLGNSSRLLQAMRKRSELLLGYNRAAEATALAKEADSMEKEVNANAKEFQELKKKQLDVQSQAALGVKDAASLKQMGDILFSMNAKPSDWPTEWNDKAKVYMKNFAAATDAQQKALEAEAKLAHQKAQTSKEYASIQNMKEDNARADKQLQIQRELKDFTLGGGNKTAAEKRAERAIATEERSAKYAIAEINSMLQILDEAPSVTGARGMARRGIAAITGQTGIADKFVNREELKLHEEAQNKFISKLNLMKATYARMAVGGGQLTKEKSDRLNDLLPGAKVFDDPEKTKEALQQFSMYLANSVINSGGNIDVPVYKQKKIPSRESEGQVGSLQKEYDALPVVSRSAMQKAADELGIPVIELYSRVKKAEGK